MVLEAEDFFPCLLVGVKVFPTLALLHKGGGNEFIRVNDRSLIR
jgi:hypothetical protein